MKKKLKIKGLFFWDRAKSKKERTENLKSVMNSAIDMEQTVPSQPNWQRHDTTSGCGGNFASRLYDFYRDWNDTNITFINPQDTAMFNKPEDKRKKATPLSVMNELATVPIPFSLENLDDKIAVLKDKTKLTFQRYAIEQIEGLIVCLENRKKYEEHHEFYTRFPNTTDEKIEDLLSKYSLEMKSSDLFVPTFPDDAVKIMKEYNNTTKKATGKSAVFYVIAEAEDFVKKVKKLDPILLAQSPFGFYWQILGAWDKEMLLLSEL